MAQFQISTEEVAQLYDRIQRNLQGGAAERMAHFVANLVGWTLLGVAIWRYERAYECCAASQTHLTHMAWMVLAGIAVFAITWFVMTWRKGRRAYVPGRLVLGPQSIVFADDGVVQTTPLSETRWAWAAFLHREEDDRNCYLLVEPSIGMVIPKAALSPEEAATIERHVKRG